MSVTAKKWMFSTFYEGPAKPDNFKLVEEKLDTNINDGEVLVEAEFLSVDPYMRISPFVKVFTEQRKTDTLVGTQVGKVIVSKSAKYAVGSYVYGELGWRTHTVCNESQVKPLPELGDLPRSAAIGALGMPGMTAYFGVVDIFDPKPGEVVVISAAAGAVGSLVGQICKIKGCTVIGSAGTAEKLDWLTKDLGFDHVFNYKTTKLEDALKKYAPDGVDCYFDNVGGDFTSIMVRHLKPDGRIACCGAITSYKDDDNQPTGPYPWYYIVLKRLKVIGFHGWAKEDRWPEGQKQMLDWIKQGKVKYREHVTEGFGKMPEAFIELFTGGNIGKSIVKV